MAINTFKVIAFDSCHGATIEASDDTSNYGIENINDYRFGRVWRGENDSVLGAWITWDYQDARPWDYFFVKSSNMDSAATGTFGVYSADTKYPAVLFPSLGTLLGTLTFDDNGIAILPFTASNHRYYHVRFIPDGYVWIDLQFAGFGQAKALEHYFKTRDRTIVYNNKVSVSRHQRETLGGSEPNTIIEDEFFFEALTFDQIQPLIDCLDRRLDYDSRADCFLIDLVGDGIDMSKTLFGTLKIESTLEGTPYVPGVKYDITIKIRGIYSRLVPTETEAIIYYTLGPDIDADGVEYPITPPAGGAGLGELGAGNESMGGYWYLDIDEDGNEYPIT